MRAFELALKGTIIAIAAFFGIQGAIMLFWVAIIAYFALT